MHRKRNAYNNTESNLFSEQAKFFQFVGQIFGVDAAVLCHVFLAPLVDRHLTSWTQVSTKRFIIAEKLLLWCIQKVLSRVPVPTVQHNSRPFYSRIMGPWSKIYKRIIL